MRAAEQGWFGADLVSWSVLQEMANEMIDLAMSTGVTYFDTAVSLKKKVFA